MTNGQRQVKEFMELFGQDCPTKPKQLDEATAKLRAKLIFEEALETLTKGLGLSVSLKKGGQTIVIDEDSLKEWMTDKEAITFQKQKEVDLVELADGVSDLMVVGEGTTLAAGIDAEPIHSIVCAANLSKVWRRDDLAEAKRLHPAASVKDYDGHFFRLVREDGKIIKSPNFKDPMEAIRAEIERQQG